MNIQELKMVTEMLSSLSSSVTDGFILYVVSSLFTTLISYSVGILAIICFYKAVVRVIQLIIIDGRNEKALTDICVLLGIIVNNGICESTIQAIKRDIKMKNITIQDLNKELIDQLINKAR